MSEANLIKAIPTRYKGYHFRSRLEARWAVFFDSLKEKWEYEPQGFVTPNGSNYLPDFYLQGMDCYLEIKPNYLPRTWDTIDKSLEKIENFSQSKSILVVCGQPWPWEYMLWSNYRGRLTPNPTGQFAICSECGALGWVVSSFDSSFNFGACSTCDCPPTAVLCWAWPRSDYSSPSKIEEAYLAARSARFEHGECGAT